MWRAGIEGLARADARILHSRAGFHQEYSFMPGHFTWDMVAIEPMDEAALLAALPGAAEIVEAVALGEPLDAGLRNPDIRSEEHTSELQSLMRISYAVFCLKKKNTRMKNEYMKALK